MEILQSSPLTAASCSSETESRAQHIRQIFRFTIFHWINENSSSRTFGDHVDPVQPPFGIGPSRLTVTDHQKLVDSWQSEKLRGKTLRLGYGGGIGLHHFCHLDGEFLSARY